ncbi:NAC domain-containing protein 41-like [Quercus lobata]|uniref:NAC domain-containing protein 41-like n=1 Tax=Quercus lobata TaxID=97700 RepID=UPI0012486184|nr:NAC domain-containing protein 41-like [Quercus lobata]
MAAASSSSSSSTPEWPGGFVFDPLDEVLVIHYLHPKATEISNCKCPEVIPECDLYGTEEPWQIWEKMEEANNCIRNKDEMFFFTRLKRVSSKSNRCKRSIGKGCWKGDGNSSNIFYCAYQNERKRIGIKKTYHYEKNNVKNDKSKSNDDDNNNNRYRWILHEISLDESLLHHAKTGDLVICRLRRHSKKEDIAPYMSASSQSINYDRSYYKFVKSSYRCTGLYFRSDDKYVQSNFEYTRSNRRILARFFDDKFKRNNN